MVGTSSTGISFRFDRQRVLCVFLCILLSGIVFSQEDDAIALPQDLTTPPPNPAEHSIKFLFCQACGMERNFLFIKHFLEAEFPGIHVDGGNYPSPPIIELLMMFMKGTQLFAMGLIIFGNGLWTNILRFRSVPTFYYKVKENYFVSFVVVFFVFPGLLKRYEKTGAFEMILDGVTVYSKLETGRMPEQGDLLAPLEAIGLFKSRR